MLVSGGGFGRRCVRRRRAGAAIVAFAFSVMLEWRSEGCECETARLWNITYSIRAVVKGWPASMHDIDK